jgi:hypothetical protein
MNNPTSKMMRVKQQIDSSKFNLLYLSISRKSKNKIHVQNKCYITQSQEATICGTHRQFLPQKEILQGYSSSSVPNAIMSANFVLAQRK